MINKKIKVQGMKKDAEYSSDGFSVVAWIKNLFSKKPKPTTTTTSTTVVPSTSTTTTFIVTTSTTTVPPSTTTTSTLIPSTTTSTTAVVSTTTSTTISPTTTTTTQTPTTTSSTTTTSTNIPITSTTTTTIIPTTTTTTTATPLLANAGSDQVISRFSPYTELDSSSSTGNITSRTWTLLNPTVLGENGYIMKPNSIKTPVTSLQYRENTVQSGYGKGEYVYQLTVSDGVNTSTDTCKVTVNFDQLPPQKDSGGGWRYLTAGDYTSVPNGAIGDYYIDGANDGFNINGQKTEIYVPASLNITLGAGKKLLIKAGKYERVLLNFADNLVQGTQQNPVIITNSGGQVEVQRGFSVKNAKYTKVTGKYIPGISGHINYQGHANGNYAFSRGKYGIYANNCWCNMSAPGIELAGKDSSYCSVEFTEMGNGGFAGLYIKSEEAGKLDYYNIDIHDTYIHDTGGEGVYIGTTSTNNPQQLYNFKFHNNRLTRLANEGLQFGQLAGGADIYNNVVDKAATRWISPFLDSQCFGAQLGLTNGGNSFRNNVIIGAGEQLASIIVQPLASGVTNNTTNIDINNNVFIGGKGFIGNYIADNSSVLSRTLNFNNNYTGQFVFQQDKIYIAPYSHAINTQQVIRTQLTNVNLIVNNLTRDNSKTQTLSGSGSVNGTTVVGTLPQFTFNSGFSSSFNTNYSLWSYKIYRSNGDEFANSSDIRIGIPYSYNLGDLVFWQSKYYISNINNNEGNMPSGNTDAYWTKITWVDGSTTYDYPPDDYRENSSAYYRSRNIGLEDTLDVATTSTTTSTTLTPTTTTTTSLSPTTTTTTTLAPTTTTTSTLVSTTTSTTSATSGTQTLTTINGWNAYVYLPDDYNSTSINYPTILFFPGTGEIGTNPASLLVYGPNAYIANGGWNGTATVNGITTKFIVISLQPPTAYPRPWIVDTRIQTLFSTYRIDQSKLNLVGISMGGWTANQLATYKPTSGDYSYMDRINSIVNIQGVKPDDTYDATSAYPTKFAEYANHGGNELGFEQTQDGRDIATIINTMNAAVNGSAIYISTSYGGGEHGYFNNYMGNSSAPFTYSLAGNTENIYQWIARKSLSLNTFNFTL